MCKCYDPSGPKYCDMHKEMISSNYNMGDKGLESVVGSYSQ